MRYIDNGVEYEVLKNRPKELKGLEPILIWKDKDYTYGNYKFFVKDDNLYFHRSRVKKLTRLENRNMWGKAETSYWTETPATWFVFYNFRDYTALQLINSFVDKDEKIWYDPIFKIWKDLGLPIGFQQNIFKELR